MRLTNDQSQAELPAGVLDWAALGRLVRVATLQAVGLDFAMSAAAAGGCGVDDAACSLTECEVDA
jgi:hypothetical protein